MGPRAVLLGGDGGAWQYIASSPTERDLGALDALFAHLLDDASAGKPFFDFSISNEHGGRVLNRGLIEQKEGFGARQWSTSSTRLTSTADSALRSIKRRLSIPYRSCYHV